jgi:hypothetical protein
MDREPVTQEDVELIVARIDALHQRTRAIHDSLWVLKWIWLAVVMLVILALFD